MYTFHLFLMIIFICLMIIYLIHRWILRKGEMLGQQTGMLLEEGFDSIPYPRKNAFIKTTNLPLKEYVIYSSFNSAYDGNAISLEQLGKVMYMGCRFIDLNVFATDKEELYVGFAADNAPTLVNVSLPFFNVLEYINAYAFNVDPDIKKLVESSAYYKRIRESINPTLKNGVSIHDEYVNYPLFLNIRVYRSPTSTLDIISLIETKLEPIRNKLYLDSTKSAKKITQYTPLNSIRGKIIITMDIENILQIYASPPPYDPENIDMKTRTVIERITNIKTGGDNWSSFYKYTDVEKSANTMLKIMDVNIENPTYETNALNMKLSYPYYATDVANPDSYNYILNHQIQTIPFRHYINDANLTKYVNLFEINKTPFLSLYHAYNYINKTTPLV